MGLQTEGKYLYENGEKFIIKGISYGNFDPKDTGTDTFYFDREKTKRDFELIKSANVNTIRLYQKPPAYLMEEAKSAGLKVILTLYVDYTVKDFSLKSKETLSTYRELTKDLVNFGKNYGNVAMYLLGTEIPELLLQQKGISELEQFIKKQGQKTFENFLFELHKTAKETDPDCLTSYANFPPTEFLNLNFFDIITFDVYLHNPKEFEEYLARLQNCAGNKPLLIGEMGADSLHEGEKFQSDLLEWSIPAAFSAGCAGSVVYTFADGWWSGQKVTNWQMGIVTEERKPKLAFETVKNRFKEYLPETKSWPVISVVVAGYNEERHIGNCLTSLSKLKYPKEKLEIIVVSDGSKDKTASIARIFPIQVIELKENKGLSFARNTGAKAAKGEIIAYTDADCEVGPDWLTHIAESFLKDKKIGCVGGPNITPSNDSYMAKLTALAPGAPTHVLISDTTADHVPGCNMAVRKSAWEKIGGFNEIFRIAGDDVDLEWRLQEAGYIIKYNPGAQVFHHRRSSVKTYIKQQFNYGLNESFLRSMHPERFNGFNAVWKGSIYTSYNNTANNVLSFFQKPIIYFDWFPVMYKREPHQWMHALLDVRWYAVWILFLCLLPFSKIFGILGAVMLSVGIGITFMISYLTLEKRLVSRLTLFKESIFIGLLTLSWLFARQYGQLKGWFLTFRSRDTLGRPLALVKIPLK